MDMLKKALLYTLALICCFASPMFAQEMISQLSPTSFNLAEPGCYQVNFKMPVTGPAQLQLRLNGEALESSTVGAERGNTLVVGFNIIRTTKENMILELVNPATDVAMDISPTDPFVAQFIVVKIQ